MILDNHHHHHQRWSFLSPSMCHPPRWLSRLEFLVGQRRSWSPLYLNISFATITIRRSQHHRHHHHHMLWHNQLIRIIIIIAVSTFLALKEEDLCDPLWLAMDNGTMEQKRGNNERVSYQDGGQDANTQIPKYLFKSSTKAKENDQDYSVQWGKQWKGVLAIAIMWQIRKYLVSAGWWSFFWKWYPVRDIFKKN